MLYTIMPYDAIYRRKIEAPEYIKKDGYIAEMRKDAYGRQILSRVISSDPAVYLSIKI